MTEMLVRDAEERIRSVPIWSGPIAIEPLHGGISNESYLVTDGAGWHVVRFGRDFPFHHVSREREIMTARAAHAAGFAPAVQYAEPGIMVTAFIGAKTYGAEDVRANRERIAVACEKVVNCAGQWARQVGAMAGINVPLQPVKHQYIITEKIDGLAADAPTIRDPDRRTYFKEEVGGW